MRKFRPQLAALLLTLICFLAVNASVVGAFADTTFFNFPPPVNTYGPYSGVVKGSNIPNPDDSTQNILQAEQTGVRWSVSGLQDLQSVATTVGTVFHVFRVGSNNCPARFNADDYVVATAGWMAFSVANDCGPSDPVHGFNNEKRVYWNVSSMVADSDYTGGVEYIGHNYPDSEVGKVANDIYFNAGQRPHGGGEFKGTWCFLNNGSAYAC